MADDIVTRLRCPAELCICVDAVLVNCVPCNTRLDAANDIEARDTEIERLRAEIEALHVANHEVMWHDTLIPIADALGVSIDDEHGVPRRHFQMVEAIIKEVRRG